MVPSRLLLYIQRTVIVLFPLKLLMFTVSTFIALHLNGYRAVSMAARVPWSAA